MEYDLIHAQINFAITGDRTELNFIRMYEDQLKRLNIPKTKEDSFELIATVEKYLGFGIDPQVYTARLFFSHIKRMQDESDMAELRAMKKAS